MPADWELPPGVSRGLWGYLHDPATADDYDRRLAGTPLLSSDLAFVREHFVEPGRAIDLGCGTGRLALDLARRGFWTVAVDLSEEMLRVAAAKAREAKIHVDFAKANLVDLRAFADASFEYAACLFQTLGMIVDSKSRHRALAEVRRILRPGGCFILHVHHLWFHLRTPAGRRMLLRNSFESLRKKRALGDFMMPPNQGLGEMPMHLFRRGELLGMLHSAGFKVEKLLGVSAETGQPHALQRFQPAYGFLVRARAV